VADRSRGLCDIALRGFLDAFVKFSLNTGGSSVVRPHVHQRQDVELGEVFFLHRLRRSLDTHRSVLGLLAGRVPQFGLHQQAVCWGGKLHVIIHIRYEL